MGRKANGDGEGAAMPNVLMLRPGGGYGDACFVTRVPRLLAERGHIVDVACEKSIRAVFANNPHIRKFVTVPPTHVWKDYEKVSKRYDKVYATHGHVEVGLLYRTDIKWGAVPNTTHRREKAKGKNYQDEIFKGIGLRRKAGKPEFYFTPKEQQKIWGLRDMLDRDKKKLILWQWEGSSQSKTLVYGPQYLKKAMELFPDTINYIFTWDANLQAQIPEDNRAFLAAGKVEPRESILLCKAADLVIGPESFLINAAAAFDTPKIVFMSHSTPDNLTRYFTNCQCIEPTKEVDCYPCYLIQTNFQGVYDPLKRGVCREFERNCRVWRKDFVYESLGYKCCVMLPHDEVMARIGEVLGTGR